MAGSVNQLPLPPSAALGLAAPYCILRNRYDIIFSGHEETAIENKTTDDI